MSVKKPPIIWHVADESHRDGQVEMITRHIAPISLRIGMGEVERKGLKTLAHKPTWFTRMARPDVVIGVGERCADTVLEIGVIHPKAKKVMLYHPGDKHEQFDLVIVPGYEPHPEGKHILTTIGLVNHITEELLQEEHEQIEKNEKVKRVLLNRPTIAVLVGGKHVGGTVSEENIRRLAFYVNKYCTEMGATALVSTCARTDDKASNILKKLMFCPHVFYNYKYDRHVKNPYVRFLTSANAIIVTGDSVRMCSEACSTGKPVYIYATNEMSFTYQALHDQFYSADLARPLTDWDVNWMGSSFPLNEAGSVARRIKGII